MSQSKACSSRLSYSWVMARSLLIVLFLLCWPVLSKLASAKTAESFNMASSLGLTAAPPVTFDGVTISNVQVNGGGASVSVQPGAILSVTLDYKVADANCPNCIKQIVFGYSNEPKPNTCIYNGIPGAIGVTGSATFSIAAPTTPGVYMIGVDNPAQFSCNDALINNWWSGAPDASRSIVTVVVSNYQGVTLSNVRINGGSNTAVVQPGAPFTVTLDYNIYDAICPNCIDQILIGFSDANPAACIYNGIPGAAGAYGSATFVLNAPATTGVHKIGYDRSQQFSCNDALSGWWNGPPKANRIIGIVGDVIAYDYGDAPDPGYPTQKINNGASHLIVGNLHLGATVDAENDGQPTANASGDDDNGDDEDGVIFPATLATCQQVALTVTPAAAGVLNAWVDFNADGDWSDTGEQIFRGLSLGAGSQALSFAVPCTAKPDINTAARFRFGSATLLDFAGEAFDGEVEDYVVKFERGGPNAQPDTAETNENTAIVIKVLANDSDAVSGPVALTAVEMPAQGLALIEGDAIRYTPKPDFTGSDSFVYTIHNEINKEAKTLVTINVRHINSAPTDINLSNDQVTALPKISDTCRGIFLNQIRCIVQSINRAMLPGGTVIGKLSTVDPDLDDSHTYFISGPAGTPFILAGDELRSAGNLEIGRAEVRQFDVVVKSQDRQNAAFERSFKITVFGPVAPDDPTGISLNGAQAAENQPANTIVGTLSTTDPKTNVHTYTLVAGVGSDDNAAFTIDGATLKTAQALDYETKESYSVRVRSLNNQNKAIEQNFSVAVLDDNNEPGEPAPQKCANGPLKLLDTGEVTIEVTNVTVTGSTANGCNIQGQLRVRIPGSEAAGITFSGRVDSKNQLYSETALAAQNASASPQATRDIGGFNLTVAGLKIDVRSAKIEYYMGRPSLRLTNARWCAPEEWGGFCAPVSTDMLIDSSGLKTGASSGFLLPEFALGKVASKLPGPRLVGLKATLKPVAGGYEITAAGQLGIPKLPAKTKASECGLSASLTLYVDAVTGATVMKLQAAPRPQAPTTADSVALREVSIGIECDKGIPIDTSGLQLTGVRGTLSLRPGEQYISLGVTIETLAKAGPFTLAKIEGDAKVLWDPKWGFDLVATLKLLGFLNAARSEMNIRENRFHFDGYIQGVITRGELRLDAWTDSGANFYMTGTGKLTLGIPKGALYSSRDNALVMAAQTGQAAKSFGFFDFVDDAIDTVKDIGSDVIDTVSDVADDIADTVSSLMSIDLPPVDLTVGSLNGDFGRFTNNQWGVKGYIKLSDVVGNTAQSVLDFFHVPSEFGVFIGSSGDLDFGGVTEYTLVTPPPIVAARQRWQMRQAAQKAGTVVTATADEQLADQKFAFVNENEVIINTPLTLDEPVVHAATVISQVRISAPSTVNFMLTNYQPLTMTLIAPDGTHITPANYNQPPINQKYQIDYEVRTIYETIDRKSAVDPKDARLRFISLANEPALAAIDVLVDGVVMWKNVKPFNPAARDPAYNTNYIAIEPGVHALNVVPTGQSTVILSTTLDAQLGVGYTLATAGADVPGLRLFSDEQSTPPSFGQAYARFVHLGDTNRKIKVQINGVTIYDELSYPNASAYQFWPVGNVRVEVVDAVTGVVLAPERVMALGDTSFVFTFFLFDRDTTEYPLDYIGTIDKVYLPQLYTIYSVGGADMGDWKVDLAGDLTNPQFALAVNAFADPTQVRDVTVDASNLSQTKVNWALTSEFAPTQVTLYANPGELTSPLSYTNTAGISVTEQITNFMGFPVTQVTLTDPSQLNNAAGSLTADLSKLESGTYRLWLKVDDGVNPPRSRYAVKPGTQEIEVITVDNAGSFPQTWTPVVTTTVDVDNANLGVQWTGLAYPDIDSYTLYMGTTPDANERTDQSIVAYYHQNADGEPIGGPLANGSFSNIEPGKTYFLFIEANDENSGRSVKSPTFSVTISAGDYALTTPSNSYNVAPGEVITVPVTLQVMAALFNPDVALSIDDEALPRGIRAQFAHDTLGQTSLTAPSGVANVTAAGATGVLVVQSQRQETDRMAQSTVDVVISVASTTQPGTYALTLTGYNGQGNKRSQTLTLQIGAQPLQTQTMCYGDKLGLNIDVQPAASLTFDLVVIMGTLPPNLVMSGTATCVPYTGIRSMVELGNRLVTQGCANNTACNVINRIIFNPDSGYHIETIQTVQTVTDLFMPLIKSARCSDIFVCQ